MTHNTQQLEKMLNEYIAGELPFAAYRQKRSQYINDYIDHCEKDNTLRMPQINLTGHQNTAYQSQQGSFTVPKGVNKAPNISSTVLKLFIIILLVSVAGVVWYVSVQKIKPDMPTENISQETSIEESIIDSQNTLEQTVGLFIFQFIERDNWSTNALSDFIVHWKSLTRKQQTMLRKTPSFIQLSTSLRNRINEQKALKEIDDKAKQQESLLIWFSTQLSISIS